MFTMIIGNNTLKRFKLQWHEYNGKRYFVKRTKVLHAESLDNVKSKAMWLFGSLPDTIQRI